MPPRPPSRQTSSAPARTPSPSPSAGDRISAAVSAHPDGAAIAVVAVPRSGVTAIDRVDGAAVRIRLAAPPVDGAANAALLRYLADRLGLPRSRLRLLAGAASRRKRVLVDGLSAAEVVIRLGPWLPPERS